MINREVDRRSRDVRLGDMPDVNTLRAQNDDIQQKRRENVIGRRPVRQSVILGSLSVFPFLEWSRVLQATPTTPGALNPSTLVVTNNGNNTFDPASAGAKCFLRLETPQPISNIRPRPTLAFNNIQGGVAYLGTDTIVEQQATIGVRYILEAFDCSTITWNDIAGLSLSTRISKAIAAWSTAGTPTTQSTTGNGNNLQNVELNVNETTMVHGFLLDMKPYHSRTTGIFTAPVTFTSRTGSITFSTSSSNPPYMIVPSGEIS
jgi:hypothetical protein